MTIDDRAKAAAEDVAAMQLTWDPNSCTCRCSECGEGIVECACEDLEVEHECDCSDAWVPADE